MGAAMAVATGQCDVAVAIRSRNRGSGGRPWSREGAAPRMTGAKAFEFPYGLFNPVGWIALQARSYMHRYGATPATFASVAVAQRANAVHNPNAFYRDPITVEDVLASRMIADPLHLLDCCPEMDAAMAVIVTSRERARDLQQKPVLIAGAVQGNNGRSNLHMSGVYSKDPLDYAAKYAAADLYKAAGITARDIDAAMLYDMFSPVVIFGLETWGFCNRGEGGAFVESGGIDFDGQLPVNTHGGSALRGVPARLQPHPRRRSADSRDSRTPTQEGRQHSLHGGADCSDERCDVPEGPRTNTNAQAARPLPDTEDALAKPFWDAAKNKRLVMHRLVSPAAPTAIRRNSAATNAARRIPNGHRCREATLEQL